MLLIVMHDLRLVESCWRMSGLFISYIVDICSKIQIAGHDEEIYGLKIRRSV